MRSLIGLTLALAGCGVYDTTDPAQPVALPGFHANVRTDDAEVLAALAPLAVPVATPAFVFA